MNPVGQKLLVITCNSQTMHSLTRSTRNTGSIIYFNDASTEVQKSSSKNHKLIRKYFSTGLILIIRFNINILTFRTHQKFYKMKATNIQNDIGPICPISPMRKLRPTIQSHTRRNLHNINLNYSLFDQ